MSNDCFLSVRHVSNGFLRRVYQDGKYQFRKCARLQALSSLFRGYVLRSDDS